MFNNTVFKRFEISFTNQMKDKGLKELLRYTLAIGNYLNG
jgi:hypothetical protein